MNKKKITVIAVICSAIIIAGALCLYLLPGRQNDSIKKLTLNIENGNYKQTVEIETAENNLGAALKENNLITGTDQSQGFFVTAVNGIEADSENGYYWMFYDKNNELLPSGVEDTPINDGDIFNIKCEQFEW